MNAVRPCAPSRVAGLGRRGHPVARILATAWLRSIGKALLHSLSVTPLLLLVAAAPTVVVHVAEVDGFDAAQARDLAARFCDAVEQQTAGPCVLSNAEWQECSGEAACVAGLRATARADEVVLMRFFGGALSILVSGERFLSDGRAVPRESFEHELGRVNEVELRRLATKLYPFDTSLSTAATNLASIESERPISWPPIAFAAVSAGAAATAIGFGLKARSSQTRLESNFLTEANHADLLGQQSRQATVANTMIGVASASAIGALVWWLLVD